MNFNFELILFYAVLVAGSIALIDKLFFAAKRLSAVPEREMPVLVDYARSFFPILLIVFLFRSFGWEPFRIPSGSLEPTLLTGDFIVVNKFYYGFRIPVIHTKIYNMHTPHRGEILVFRWPPNPSYDFIKRIIGVPGDHIRYVNKTLFVNNTPIPQTFLTKATTQAGDGTIWEVLEKEENLLGTKHHIYINPDRSSYNYNDIVVPPERYFVMGDNRDDSADSRYWGFVRESDIVGKAAVVWFSWRGISQGFFRWNRIGKPIT